MTIGERLVELRRKNSLTQARLSDLSGVPQTTISGIENSNKTPGLKNAIKIAKVFGIHTEDLLEDNHSVSAS